MAEMLHIDIHLVSMAISVFCRLGFAKKRVTGRSPLLFLTIVILGMENAKLHFTWAQVITIPTSPTMDEMVSSVSGGLGELSAALASPMGEGDEEDDEMATSVSSLPAKEAVGWEGVRKTITRHRSRLPMSPVHPVGRRLFSTPVWPPTS